MDKKIKNKKIKYGVASCIIALSMIIGISAPNVFKASEEIYIDGYSGGNNYSTGVSGTKVTIINNTVYSYKDYYAGGSVHSEYTVFDSFITLYSFRCPDTYSAIKMFIKDLHINFVSTSNINGYQFVCGTWEELQKGEYHTILAADGVVDLTITNWEEIVVENYGKGEEVYVALVMNCFVYGGPSQTTQLGNLSVNVSGTYFLYGLDLVGAADMLYQQLLGMYAQNDAIIEDLNNLWYKHQLAEVRLDALVEYIQLNYNMLQQNNARIIQLSKQLDALNDKADVIVDGVEDINKELDTQTNWLSAIWNSIQELIGISKDKQEQQQQTSNSASGAVGSLGNLSNDLNFSKPDVDNINVDVNVFIPQDYIDSYTQLISVFTTHTVVKNMLLVAFTICVISYTLFGKRK